MVEVIAYYTVWDRRTGDRIEDYDVFKVDDRDAADKLIKKIDNGNYDSFAIQEI